MKRFTVLFLVLAISLSLAACAGNTVSDDLGSNNTDDSVQMENSGNVNDTAETEVPDEPLITDAAGREEEIYTQWLLDGNYEKLVQDTKIKPKNERTYAHLEDLNGDGVRDLLFSIPSYGTIPTFLLTIYNGKVMCVASETYSSAEKYDLMTDTATGKQVVVLWYNRVQTAKSPIYERTYTVYDFEGDKLIPRVKISKFACDPAVSGADEIEKLKAETEHYNYMGNSFHWWKINENYVSSEDYTAAISRYKSYDTRMELGSYSDPLALNK